MSYARRSKEAYYKSKRSFFLAVKAKGRPEKLECRNLPTDNRVYGTSVLCTISGSWWESYQSL
jgi:hypothetical protein